MLERCLIDERLEREREVNGVVVGDMSYEEDGREGSVIKGGGGGG